MLQIAIVGAVLTLATWLGYPLLMAAVAAVVPRGRGVSPVTGPLPHVTAVLATREGNEEIVARVQNLFETDYPGHRFDVVIAIDANRPDAASSEDIARRLPDGVGVRIVAGDAAGGKASNLNAALRVAEGDVVVFGDTAQRFERETVSRLVDELRRDTRYAGVSGALYLSASEERSSAVSWYWRLERWLRATEARLHSPVGVTGAVYAMRRALWQPLPTGLILDDLYVPMLQVLNGHRIGFRADAIATDARAISGGSEYKRKSRTLTGVFQLCAWLPGVLNPLRNPIWFQFVCHKLLRMATPWFLLMIAVGGSWWFVSLLPPSTALLLVGTILLIVVAVYLVSGRARRIAGELIAVQAAVMRATRNAVRGEWDVW